MKQNRFFAVLTGLALLVTALTASACAPATVQGQGPASAQAAVVDVQVGPNMTNFSPQTVTIHVGDTVRWTWKSDTHTVTSGANGTADNKFCSPNEQNCSAPVASNTGFVYQHTFTQVGSYPYYCAFHFASGMTGTVVVTP